MEAAAAGAAAAALRAFLCDGGNILSPRFLIGKWKLKIRELKIREPKTREGTHATRHLLHTSSSSCANCWPVGRTGGGGGGGGWAGFMICRASHHNREVRDPRNRREKRGLAGDLGPRPASKKPGAQNRQQQRMLRVRLTHSLALSEPLQTRAAHGPA